MFSIKYQITSSISDYINGGHMRYWNSKKFARLLFPSLLLVMLSGCLEVAYDTGRLAKIEGERQAWKRLANNGDAEAQYKLGHLYCCGERPYKNNVEALRWWCDAAKNGQRDAMLEVGKLYESSADYKGSIIPQDHQLAYMFYSLAMDHQNPDAEEYRDNITRSLTAEQISDAHVMMKLWPRFECKISR